MGSPSRSDEQAEREPLLTRQIRPIEAGITQEPPLYDGAAISHESPEQEGGGISIAEHTRLRKLVNR